MESNADENVIFLDETLPPNVARQKYPKLAKYFYSDVRKDTTHNREIPGNVLWFSLCNEAREFATQGFYSRLEFRPRKPKLSCKFEYIVIHSRNQPGPRDSLGRVVKNMEPDFLNAIFRFFEDKGLKMVLVGNDDPLAGEQLSGDVLDLRHKLKLEEIAWLMNHAKLFVGKDSGLGHLAGCCRVPMVMWGFQTRQWFPQTRNRLLAFERRQSTVEAVLGAIKEQLE